LFVRLLEKPQKVLLILLMEIDKAFQLQVLFFSA